MLVVEIEEVEGIVGAVIRTMETMPPKERAQQPFKQFGKQFNTALELAREALPEVDHRL